LKAGSALSLASCKSNVFNGLPDDVDGGFLRFEICIEPFQSGGDDPLRRAWEALRVLVLEGDALACIVRGMRKRFTDDMAVGYAVHKPFDVLKRWASAGDDERHIRVWPSTACVLSPADHLVSSEKGTDDINIG